MPTLKAPEPNLNDSEVIAKKLKDSYREIRFIEDKYVGLLDNTRASDKVRELLELFYTHIGKKRVEA